MMTNKVWTAFIVIALVLTGCGPSVQEEATETWHLTIVGKAGSKELSLEDIKALPSKEVRFQSKETGTTNAYQGVLLADLLEAAGVDASGFESLAVEATDGFLGIYGRELALREDVVLAYEMDGGPLPSEMGRARMIALGQANRLQVRFVSRITAK